MTWLVGHWTGLWIVALKSVLLYATALIALRLGTRRTLAQMSLFDIVTAVAVGAIIGRTATSSTTSYAEGAVALVTLIAIHRLVSVLRYRPAIRRMTDHRIRILIDHGRIRRHQLWICGLTQEDLMSALRVHGSCRLDEVQLVLYEPEGNFSIFREPCAGDLIDSAVASAAKEPPP